MAWIADLALGAGWDASGELVGKHSSFLIECYAWLENPPPSWPVFAQERLGDDGTSTAGQQEFGNRGDEMEKKKARSRIQKP